MAFPQDIAKGRGQKAEGRREKIDGSWFQYLARVPITLATAINHRDGVSKSKLKSQKCFQDEQRLVSEADVALFE
jgi:hypothetical protein